MKDILPKEMSDNKVHWVRLEPYAAIKRCKWLGRNTIYMPGLLVER